MWRVVCLAVKGQVFNMKRLLILALLCVFGCTFEQGTIGEPASESVGETQQPLVVGCKIEINNIDWVVDSATSGHTQYQFKNVGNQACSSYKVQSEVIKNGVSYGGPVRGPYAMDPGPSVSPTRTDNFNVATNPFGSCRYTIWVKYRKGLDMTVEWHNLIPADASNPSGLVCE
jgi:hypothetical protein